MAAPKQVFVFADFAGRRRKFQLTIGGVGELERLCDAGVGAIMVRLATHQFRAADIRETVRLGMEGGGATEPEATACTMTCIDGVPLAEHMALAIKILEAYVNGVPDEIKKNKRAAARRSGENPAT